MQNVGALQHRADGAHQRDLEAIEHPGDAESDDQQPMKAAPRQPVEARGNQRFNYFRSWERRLQQACTGILRESQRDIDLKDYPIATWT